MALHEIDLASGHEHDPAGRVVPAEYERDQGFPADFFRKGIFYGFGGDLTGQ